MCKLVPSVVSILCLASVILSGCGGPSSRADANTNDAVSAKEEPNYAKAFPQDRVPRLDIKISAKNWQAMVDDMTSMAGTFGSQSGLGGPKTGRPDDGGVPGGMPNRGDGGPIARDIPGMGDGGAQEGGVAGAGGVDLFPRTPVYVECDVATADRSWQHVGIRLKGNSSLRSSWSQGVWKLPLRLNFDRYEDTYPETKNQRFYGFKALSLSNGLNDASLLRDKIGTEVFANAGLPAPASAFYRIYVDHGEGPTYFGLYTVIELPSDESFLDKFFGGHKGNLYKPEGTGAQWSTWDQETLNKENNEEAADYSDARALFDALHAERTDVAQWRAGLEARLDVKAFLYWLALNTVIEDWDTYGHRAHNYYLYADPAVQGRFTWIPWDHSCAFWSNGSAQSGLSLSLSEVGEPWPLIRYLIDDPQYLATYRSFLAQVVQKEYEPTAAAKRFQVAHELIAPYVVGTEGEIAGHTFLSSATAFDDALAELVRHASSRAQQVTTFLAQ